MQLEWIYTPQVQYSWTVVTLEVIPFANPISLSSCSASTEKQMCTSVHDNLQPANGQNGGRTKQVELSQTCCSIQSLNQAKSPPSGVIPCTSKVTLHCVGNHLLMLWDSSYRFLPSAHQNPHNEVISASIGEGSDRHIYAVHFTENVRYRSIKKQKQPSINPATGNSSPPAPNKSWKEALPSSSFVVTKSATRSLTLP